MDDSDQFLSELNGTAERIRTHAAVKRGRDSSRRQGLRPSEVLRPVNRFDIGSDGTTDMQGRPLYKAHKVEDDDDTTVEDLMQVWDDIPCDDDAKEDSQEQSDSEADVDYVDGQSSSSSDEESLSEGGESDDALSPTS